MSLYLVVLIFLLISALIELSSKNSHDRLYWICFIVLTAFLCLRYGQGVDYFGYQYGYHQINPSLSISGILDNTIDVHGEIGWKYLMSIFKLVGLDFEILVLAISLFQMYCINRFIRRFCAYKILALLMIYPTLYLTYFFSGLRQGIVLALFLGFMLEMFFERKYVKYIILCVVCILFHTVSVVLFLAFLTESKLFKNRKAILTTVVACWLFGTVIGFTGITFSAFSRVFSAELIPSMAMIERICLFVIVTICYSYAYPHISEDSVIHKSYKLYSLGMVIYGLFIAFALISRVSVFFKLLEVLLIGFCLPYVNKRTRHVFVILILLLQIVMTLKNLNSYLAQGMYYADVSMWNYPYVSIFNKEAIYRFRFVRTAFIFD